jgi:hypothetical protein
MLSLRSLAFILCSAIRRSRALSCSALHCFPDRTKAKNIGRNMLTSVPATNTKSRRSMCSFLRTAYTSQGDHGSGRNGPFSGPARPVHLPLILRKPEVVRAWVCRRSQLPDRRPTGRNGQVACRGMWGLCLAHMSVWIIKCYGLPTSSLIL